MMLRLAITIFQASLASAGTWKWKRRRGDLSRNVISLAYQIVVVAAKMVDIVMTPSIPGFDSGSA
jgi:hypothetical protein